MPPEWKRYAYAFALCAFAGCAGTRPQKAPPMAAAIPSPAPSVIAPLLGMMSELPAADPVRQAELFESVKDAAALSPTTSNKLKLGLALAAPGHAGTDPVAAQRQLSELLAAPETLAPEERLLAVVELQEVDQRLILIAENKQLQDDASHDSREKQLALSRRLAAESDENAHLRKALDEAQAKLEAVTHIERSINNRGPNTAHTP